MATANGKKREHNRAPLNVRYTGEGKGFYLSDYSYDISESGIGLHTIRNLSENEIVSISFVLPDGQEVAVRGEVVWTGSSIKTLRRTGVRFVEVDSQARDSIRMYVQRSSEA